LPQTSEPGADRKGWEAGLQSLQQGLDGMASEIAELRRQPILSLAPGRPEPGLNLNKRGLKPSASSAAVTRLRRSPPRWNCRARKSTSG
jgi:hypothetical protein